MQAQFHQKKVEEKEEQMQGKIKQIERKEKRIEREDETNKITPFLYVYFTNINPSLPIISLTSFS